MRAEGVRRPRDGPGLAPAGAHGRRGHRGRERDALGRHGRVLRRRDGNRRQGARGHAPAHVPGPPRAVGQRRVPPAREPRRDGVLRPHVAPLGLLHGPGAAAPGRPRPRGLCDRLPARRRPRGDGRLRGRRPPLGLPVGTGRPRVHGPRQEGPRGGLQRRRLPPRHGRRRPHGAHLGPAAQGGGLHAARAQLAHRRRPLGAGHGRGARDGVLRRLRQGLVRPRLVLPRGAHGPRRQGHVRRLRAEARRRRARVVGLRPHLQALGARVGVSWLGAYMSASTAASSFSNPGFRESLSRCSSLGARPPATLAASSSICLIFFLRPLAFFASSSGPSSRIVPPI
mmetsp:Transcript_27005/g.89273  ORF Transcript_27005/g.89273 Transcript_27005/m.89273 type:complete len:340 (-) Transcript_27005:108-1127(-)